MFLLWNTTSAPEGAHSEHGTNCSHSELHRCSHGPCSAAALAGLAKQPLRTKPRSWEKGLRVQTKNNKKLPSPWMVSGACVCLYCDRGDWEGLGRDWEGLGRDLEKDREGLGRDWEGLGGDWGDWERNWERNWDRMGITGGALEGIGGHWEGTEGTGGNWEGTGRNREGLGETGRALGGTGRGLGGLRRALGGNGRDLGHWEGTGEEQEGLGGTGREAGKGRALVFLVWSEIFLREHKNLAKKLQTHLRVKEKS